MKSLYKAFRKSLPLTVLALPGFLVLLLFNYVPLFGLVLPFKNYRVDLGFWQSSWSGFKNFEFLFSGKEILNATVNTILYNSAFILLGTALAVALAVMLFELTAGYVKLYQTIIFLPYFISWVVGAFIVYAFLDMNYGFINILIKHFGGQPILWYNETGYWPPIILITYLWKTMGHSTVIYYAALMGINPEYFEAAKLDGAGKIKQIFLISIPMIKRIMIMMMILSIGRILNSDFGLFYNVTMNSTLLYRVTDVVDTFVYRALIDIGDIGMSSAAAFYQSVVGFLLVMTSNFLISRIDDESAIF